MRKHQLTRQSKRGAGDFAPFFDWDESEQSPPVYPMPAEGLVERIAEGCERWIRQGGLIVRFHFGVSTENCKRDERGNLSGTYKVGKHCCPLAPLLEGLPSRFHPLADFAAVLGVDQFWVIGFVHGVDGTVKTLTGKRADYFEESLTYVEGREAGAQIAERYIHIPGGWEV
jgi:hypothetical protein